MERTFNFSALNAIRNQTSETDLLKSRIYELEEHVRNKGIDNNECTYNVINRPCYDGCCFRSTLDNQAETV
jgi:hypothetical protein